MSAHKLEVCNNDNILNANNMLSLNDFNDMFSIMGILGQGGSGDVVFKVTMNDQIVAMKTIPYMHPKNNIIRYSEINMGCKMNNLQHYTHSLMPILYYVIFNKNVLTMLTDKLEHYYDIDEYSDAEIVTEDYGYGNCVIIIINPLLLNAYNYIYNPRWKPRPNDFITATKENHIDIMFETLYALIILNMNNIIHGDIANRNIRFMKVNKNGIINKRQYTINNTIYLVEYEYMPVWIDFGNSVEIKTVKPLADEYIDEYIDEYENVSDLFEVFNFDRLLSVEDKALFNTKNFPEILLSKIFEPLRNRNIMGGDNVTIFTAINID